LIIVCFHENSYQELTTTKINRSFRALFGHHCIKHVYPDYTVLTNYINFGVKKAGMSVEINKTGIVEIAHIVSRIPGFGSKMMRAVLDCLDNGTTVVIEDVNNNAAFFNKFRAEYPSLKFEIYSE
jgi:hypothetical protein